MRGTVSNSGAFYIDPIVRCVWYRCDTVRWCEYNVFRESIESTLITYLLNEYEWFWAVNICMLLRFGPCTIESVITDNDAAVKFLHLSHLRKTWRGECKNLSYCINCSQLEVSMVISINSLSPNGFRWARIFRCILVLWMVVYFCWDCHPHHLWRWLQLVCHRPFRRSLLCCYWCSTTAVRSWHSTCERSHKKCHLFQVQMDPTWWVHHFLCFRHFLWQFYHSIYRQRHYCCFHCRRTIDARCVVTHHRTKWVVLLSLVSAVAYPD